MKRFYLFLSLLTVIVQAKQLQPVVTEHPQWREWTVDIQETFEDGSQRVVLQDDEPMSNRRVVLRFIQCVKKDNVASLTDEKGQKLNLPRLTYRAWNGAEYVCTYEEK